MTETVYVVLGGIDNFPEFHDDVKTFQLFHTQEGAEVYRKDLVNGTNFSGLRGHPPKESGWTAYDSVSVQTLRINP